ncbi:MAG TPA: hypothetical protein VFZ37_16600 [Jiangellaceae bacterium]
MPSCVRSLDQLRADPGFEDAVGDVDDALRVLDHPDVTIRTSWVTITAGTRTLTL